MSQVVLVDEQDHELGTMDKMEVHYKGILHRAFSIFIFNKRGEMLLQQRAAKKYHSGGLWTNACCSHPLQDDTIEKAALKRLQEEMGFTTPIKKAFTFTYRADVGDGLTEHEYDHVFTGIYNGAIVPAEAEVQDFCYMSLPAITSAIESHPHKYTQWFKIAFPKIQDYLTKE